MQYTAKQIESAKSAFNMFNRFETLANYNVEAIGINEAESRMFRHNDVVLQIRGGNKEVANYWKKFFLSEAVMSDRKIAESKAKLTANKEASADVLAPVKEAKKLVDFGKWLNTPGNVFRKEHFSKKYTQESVNTFLSL